MAARRVALCIAVLVLAVIGVLLAERRQNGALKIVCKPVASTAFVVLGLEAGNLATPAGRWVMAALALGWVGDVTLLGRGKLAFVLGLGSFLVGHAAFCAAFLVRGVSWPVVALAAVALVVTMRRLWVWLKASIPRSLRPPVLAYFAVISAMVALAAGTSWAEPPWMILAGAVMFALSDVSVARDRFQNAGFSNKAWGLPLYFAAQCLLAVSVARGA